MRAAFLIDNYLFASFQTLWEKLILTSLGSSGWSSVSSSIPGWSSISSSISSSIKLPTVLLTWAAGTTGAAGVAGAAGIALWIGVVFLMGTVL